MCKRARGRTCADALGARQCGAARRDQRARPRRSLLRAAAERPFLHEVDSIQDGYASLSATGPSLPFTAIAPVRCTTPRCCARNSAMTSPKRPAIDYQLAAQSFTTLWAAGCAATIDGLSRRSGKSSQRRRCRAADLGVVRDGAAPQRLRLPARHRGTAGHVSRHRASVHGMRPLAYAGAGRTAAGPGQFRRAGRRSAGGVSARMDVRPDHRHLQLHRTARHVGTTLLDHGRNADRFALRRPIRR